MPNLDIERPSLSQCDQGFCLSQGDRDRFFNKDMFTGLKSGPGIGVVEFRRAGNKESIAGVNKCEMVVRYGNIKFPGDPFSSIRINVKNTLTGPIFMLTEMSRVKAADMTRADQTGFEFL